MANQQGRPPTEEEKFYRIWGQETLKNNITLCNDILKQLISISSALLGVTIIFDKIIDSDVLKSFVQLSFFLCLIISFIGLLPYEKKVELQSLEKIKEHKEKALRHKRNFLWVSAFTIVVGFGIIIGELLIKTFILN